MQINVVLGMEKKGEVRKRKKDRKKGKRKGEKYDGRQENAPNEKLDK